MARTRSGRIRATRRFADGPKVIAFCPTIPPPIGPRPGPGPAWIRSVALKPAWGLGAPFGAPFGALPLGVPSEALTPPPPRSSGS